MGRKWVKGLRGGVVAVAVAIAVAVSVFVSR
jgi:hypothetical protein